MVLAFAACDAPTLTFPERSIPYIHNGVPWVIDDDHRYYLVDTGTPRTFVVPPVAGLDDTTFVSRPLEGWDVFGLGEGEEVVVTWELPPAILPMIGPGFGGIIGADLLSQQPFSLDPVMGRITLDDDGDFTEHLRGTEPPVHVPVVIAGGGTICLGEGRCVEHDGLRVLVEVEVEGEPVLALLDTASTYTSMGRALFERLDAVRQHPQVSIERGWDVWDFARVRSIAVADASLAQVPVRVDPRLDVAFARLEVETGHRVELLLGHSFLLHFVLGVDHPSSTLTLARFSAPRDVETEMFESVGVWLLDAVETSGCLAVGALAHGSEAEAAGVDVGDCVVEVDGTVVTRETAAQTQQALEEAEVGRVVRLTVVDALAVVDGDAHAESGAPPRVVELTKHDLLERADE